MPTTNALQPPRARPPVSRTLSRTDALANCCDQGVRRTAFTIFFLAVFVTGWLAMLTSLSAQSTPPQQLTGHTAAMNAVTYSADQRYVVTAGADNLIKIWDAKTGEEIRSLAGHTGQVLSLAISPDDGVIVSGAADNSIRMWDIPRPEPLRVFPTPTTAVRDVAVSPNGQWAVSVGEDKLGRVWKLADGSPLMPLEGHTDVPLVVAVRADNNQFASGDASGQLWTWSSIDGKSQGNLGAHIGAVRGVAFHPNNQQLISAGDDGLLKLWQLPFVPPRTLASEAKGTGEVKGTGEAKGIRAVAITGDGQLTLVGGDDSVRVFNVTNGQPVRELAGALGTTSAVALSPNNALAAAAGAPGAIKFWNLGDGADRWRIAGHDVPIRGLAFHPDSSRIASASDDGTVRIWRVPPAPVPVNGHTADVAAVAISGNGQLAATASADKSVRIWNPANGQAIRSLNGHEQPLRDVAIRADSGELASGDAAGEVRVWSAADGSPQATIGAHSLALNGLAYAPAGDRLTTVGEDGCLKVWSLPALAPRPLAGNAAAVTAVAMTGDGKLLVTGGADKTIRVYDAANGQQIRALVEVPEAVASLAISPGDAITAAGAINGVIKLWNTADGSVWKGLPTTPATPADAAAPVAPPHLLGHDGPVLDLAFDSQAARLISAGADGTIRLWRLPTAAREIRDPSGPMARFVVSPDGKLAAAAGTVQDRPAVLLSDLASGKIVHALLGHEGPIGSLAFDRTGKKLVTGAADSTARVWDLADPKFPEIQKLPHPSAVNSVGLSDDASQVFSAAADNVIRCHTVVTGEEVRTFAGHGGAVTALRVAGATLFSSSADGTVRMWNTQTGAAIRTINHGAAVASLAVDPLGKTLVSGGADNLVKVWNSADGAALASLAGHAAAIVDLQFSTDGTRLASLANDGVWLWDLAGKRRLESFSSTQVELRGLGFVGAPLGEEKLGGQSVAGEALAVGVADGTVRMLTPHLVLLLDAHVGGVASVAISPDGQRAVSSGMDKTVRVWSLTDGKPLATLAGPTDVVTNATISRDGLRVVGGGRDKMLRVWPLPAAATAQPVPVQAEWELPSPVSSLDMSADTGRVAVGGDDQVIRVWSLELGCELERFSGHTAAIRQVVISSDGRTVLSGGADNLGRLSTLSLQAAVKLPTIPRDAVYLPDGSRIAVATDGGLTFWQLKEGVLEAAGQLPAAGATVEGYVSAAQLAVAVRGDGLQLASLDSTGRVHVWSVADGKLAYAVPAAEQVPPAAPAAVAAPTAQPAAAAAAASEPARPAGSLRYSTDHGKLAVAHGQRLRVLQADTGRMLEQFDVESPLADVAFTTDQQSLLVGRIGPQNQATLLPVCLRRLIEAHPGGVTSLAFSPDGNGLATGGADKLVRWWSTESGELVRTYAGASDAITCLTVTRDATRIVAGSQDQQAYLWPVNPPAGEPPQPNTPSSPLAPRQTWNFPAPIRGIAVSPDNTKLAAAADDGVTRVHDLNSGLQLERFSYSDQPVLSVAFAPDNKTLVTGGADKDGRVWTLAWLRTIAAEQGPIRDLALVAGGAQAVTAGPAGIQQWNLGDGNLLRKMDSMDADFLSVAVRNDNAQVVAADVTGHVTLWNLANGQLTARIKAPAVVSRIRYSADNQKIVTVGLDNHLRFFSPVDGSPTYELASEKPLSGVVFTTDNRTVLSGGEQLNQWLFASPDPVRTLNGHGGGVYSLTYSPDGRWIASASADQTVRIWDATTGAQSKQLSGHQGPVFSVVFSPDGALLASCGADNSVRLWDTLGGRQLKQMPVGDGSLYTVTFLADGKRLATAGLDRKIFVLDALTGQLLSTLDKHTDYLYRLATNRSGTRLLSCGYGGNVMIWNTANFQPTFAADLELVSNFADLSPEGDRIVVAGGNGRAYFVDVPAAAR